MWKSQRKAVVDDSDGMLISRSVSFLSFRLVFRLYLGCIYDTGRSKKIQIFLCVCVCVCVRVDTEYDDLAEGTKYFVNRISCAVFSQKN